MLAPWNCATRCSLSALALGAAVAVGRLMHASELHTMRGRPYVLCAASARSIAAIRVVPATAGAAPRAGDLAAVQRAGHAGAGRARAAARAAARGRAPHALRRRRRAGRQPRPPAAARRARARGLPPALPGLGGQPLPATCWHVCGLHAARGLLQTQSSSQVGAAQPWVRGAAAAALGLRPACAVGQVKRVGATRGTAGELPPMDEPCMRLAAVCVLGLCWGCWALASSACLDGSSNAPVDGRQRVGGKRSERHCMHACMYGCSIGVTGAQAGRLRMAAGWCACRDVRPGLQASQVCCCTHGCKRIGGTAQQHCAWATWAEEPALAHLAAPVPDMDHLDVMLSR